MWRAGIYLRLAPYSLYLPEQLHPCASVAKGRTLTLSSAWRAVGAGLPSPALPYPARRSSLLRGGRTGWRCGAQRCPWCPLPPRLPPERSARPPAGVVWHPRWSFQNKTGWGVRSQVQSAFPPYCACLSACLARCFPPKYTRTVLVSLVLNRDGKFQPPSVPGCAAAAAGSPREPSGRGAACPGCPGPGRRRQGPGASCVGADPSHCGRFRWGRWNAEVATPELSEDRRVFSPRHVIKRNK